MHLKRVVIAIVALLTVAPQTAHARSGDIDYTFGRYGIASADLGSYLDLVSDVTVQKDAKILVAGYTLRRSSADFGVARFTSKGALDKTFSRDGKTTVSFGREDYARRIVPAPGGKVVVAGSTARLSYDGDTVKIESDFAVARFTASGSPDTTFSADGKTTTDFLGDNSEGEFVTALAVQSDGKIIAGGITTSEMYVDSPVAEIRERSGLIVLARYAVDGSLDPTFGAGGKVILDFLGRAELAGIAVNPDGSILLGGTQWERSENAKSDAMVVRLTSAGALDPAFGIGGRQTVDMGGEGDRISSMAMTRDRKIVLAGSTTRRSEVHFGVARFDASGAPDRTFSGDGKLSSKVGLGGAAVNDIAVASDGKIVVSGSAYVCRTVLYAGRRIRSCFPGAIVARFTKTGSYDKAFGSGGVAIPNLAYTPFMFGGSPVTTMDLQNDRPILGGMFATGQFYSIDFGLTRLVK